MSATNSPRRVLGASLVGTAVEFYDFYIYATATALVFGPLFFPSSQPGLDLLLSYATFSVAFFARPLGAVVFGHFGDRIGRKSTLVASLLIMGLSTFAIAFLPSYHVIGWLAPALLCLLRFGQGLGLGGEWSGAALLAVENAPKGYHGRWGMVPQLGAPIGFIFSNGIFLLLGLWLTDEQFTSWGWRLPFAASALLVFVGLWVRLKLTETAAFAKAAKAGPPPRVPFVDLMRDHWRPALFGTMASITCFAVFYLATTFALGYATNVRHIPRDEFLVYQLISILFLAGGILIAGWASDKFSPRLVLGVGCALSGIVGLGAAPLLGGSPLQIVTFLSAGFLAMGLCYGPLGGWLPSLFPARVRYSGVSLAFNTAGVIGGGLTPLFAQSLANAYGLGAAGAMLAASGVASLIGLAFAGRQD